MGHMRTVLLLLLTMVAGRLGADTFTLKDPPPAWHAVLQELDSDQPVKSAFEELRRNPFHRLPRRFMGHLWWDQNHGLSLQYEKPGQLTINIVADGVYMGRPGETMKSLPAEQQEEVMQLFSRLFSWDVEWLDAEFSTEGEISDGNEWTLRMRPKDEELSAKLNRIDLHGEDKVLRSILLDLRAGRTVEIRLSQQERPDAFTPEELQTAYPALNE